MEKIDDRFENKIIETIDENGNTIKFELIDLIDYDENTYGLLKPIEGFDESEVEDGEVALMKLVKENEEYSFEIIEDDDEFDKICDYIDSYDEADN